MLKKLSAFILTLSLGATFMLAQGFPLPPGVEAPMGIRIASPYSLMGQSSACRIDSGKVLPVSIAILNNKRPKQISLHFAESNGKDPSVPKPIPNAFKVLGQNPTEKVSANAYECKLFRMNIKINTDKHQRIYIYDEDNKLLERARILVNDPRYSHRKYQPFDEAELCDFSDEDGVHY